MVTPMINLQSKNSKLNTGHCILRFWFFSFSKWSLLLFGSISDPLTLKQKSRKVYTKLIEPIVPDCPESKENTLYGFA